MDKINFQDLPNTTTPINATNLNQLQTNVENAIEQTNDEISIRSNYSTTEQKIGTYLGKPLYREVIEYTTQPSTGDNEFNHGILNIDRIRIVTAIVERADGVNTIAPRYTPGETSWQFYFNDITKTKIGFNIGRDLRSDTYWNKAVFIIEYTKTTD